MAEKAAPREKKTRGEKAEAPAKATAKKRIRKGESLVCEVCGLSVVVEKVGSITLSQASALLCCGKPLKKRASKAKAAKK